MEVSGRVVGAIDRGLLLFVGVHESDTQNEIDWLARKVAALRIFADEEGRMNRSVLDVGGECLVVSQFTLYGNCRRGSRPGFTEAASAEKGEQGYQSFVQALQQEGVPVATGQFQADMQVHLVNDGPVTLWLEREGEEA